MGTTRSAKALAVMFAGTLLAVASPAIAHAGQPNSEPRSTLVGTSRLQNLKSGKYLQATSSANGARITQQPFNDNFLQDWQIFTFDGYYTFENFEADGKNLGIDGASTSSGAAAIIANGSSDLNQDWTVDRTHYSGDYFALKNRKSGLCLGISGASTATGAAAVQFPCDGSANQGWTWP
ncbi:RICIN domain-containing protein [Streptomyces sp. NPDC048448]|uniref:RICIN domain-containing protein n=1 Tax=Streptomyces sp. NPDC048448 TaxID=3365554 RepID=UPI0037190268